jgi:hypothetical protein
MRFATLSGSELIVGLTGGVAPGYYMSRLRREEVGAIRISEWTGIRPR